ncbi:MAG: BlaI family penicillinase repressor [Pirellulaceae bacterium]|jgi:predicted transcriptional regulator
MMSKQDSELRDLSSAQQEIMEVVYAGGEMSAADVRRALGRDVARNTVRTLLERMEEKGWLKHRTEGRTFLYSAAQPRKKTVARKVREFLENVCGGSPEALVAGLLDGRKLKDDELGRIRELLDQQKSRRK